MLVASLLVCLGILLGTTWTMETLQPRLRRQAEERRRLNEEWSAVRTARWRRGTCPRCASPLTERNWYIAPTIVETPPTTIERFPSVREALSAGSMLVDNCGGLWTAIGQLAVPARCSRHGDTLGAR